MIELRNVTFAYPGQTPVFERFSWRGERGDVWTVLGPSGCGKSTLLMLLAGLLRPQSGEIRVEGERVERPRPRTGLILQEYGLLPWATVQENVKLGLRIRHLYGPDGRHVPRDERIDPAAEQVRVEYWLARLGIADVAEKYPGQISGGQRQRTAIARTLVLEPDLVLMDEPFSALDAPTREGLQGLTLTLCEEASVTVVLVTHNIEEAAFVGQHVLLLNGPPNRQVRVIANPHVTDAAYRRATDYQAMCSRLRQTLSS
jgi:ABC-type nitrate/sulfonate/bicarbonate transport system ATPase subunit